jgi:hypothetical protein
VSVTAVGGWSVCSTEELIGINEVSRSHGAGLDGVYHNGAFSTHVAAPVATYTLARFDSGKWKPIVFTDSEESRNAYGGEIVGYDITDSAWENKYDFYCCAGVDGKHGSVEPLNYY